MLKMLNPKTTAAPNGVYSHGVVAPANARWLYVAGQTGVRPDGSIPPTLEEQTETVWQNIVAVLDAADMKITDVVKITSFLTRHENFAKFAPIRAKYLGAHRPASTLLIVSALAKPEFLVEVEAIAAKAPTSERGAKKKPKKAKRRSR